jgi:hypothetical protein
MLAVFKGGLNNVPRRSVLASDEFDDDIGIGAGEGLRRVDKTKVARVHGALLCPVSRRDGNDLDFPSGATRERILLLGQCPDDTDSNGAEAGQRYP